jgi:hypothetical protein
LWLTASRQITRSQDARRKTDLEKIKVAFEEYYNDNGCYPPETILDECKGHQLNPYIDQIPCDPGTKEPYVLIPAESGTCAGYRVLAALADTNDPQIEQLGCNDACGCGWGAEYNFGVSAGVPLRSDSCQPINPSPTPSAQPSTSPSPSPSGGEGPVIYVHACAPVTGTCNIYQEGHEALANCPVTFQTSEECVAAHCEREENAALRCYQ